MNMGYAVVLSVIILLTSLLSGCMVVGPEVTESFSSEYAAGENAVLNVASFNGPIEINHHVGGNITLDAVKKTRYGVDELKKVDILVVRDGNKINIETEYPDFLTGRVSVDMNVGVPAGVIVESVKTSNGEIKMSGTKGDTSALSSNGAIIIEDVAGYVSARTSNGRIDIRGTAGTGDLQTSNGKINAEIFNLRDDVNIESSNGEITVYINSSLNANIEMKTSNGKISVNDVPVVLTKAEGTHMAGTLGNGGSMIYIKTSNGNVNLNDLMV